MNWFRKKYCSLVGGVSNLISYFRLIWKDRDWDYGFMLELERKKLRRAIKWYEKNDYGVAAYGKRYCNQMRVAANCLDIILDNDWWTIDRPSDEPITEWLKNPHSDNDYVIKANINLKNWKRFMPWLTEESINKKPNLWKIELREIKAWNLYHKIRAQYMRDWWD